MLGTGCRPLKGRQSRAEVLGMQNGGEIAVEMELGGDTPVDDELLVHRPRLVLASGFAAAVFALVLLAPDLLGLGRQTYEECIEAGRAAGSIDPGFSCGLPLPSASVEFVRIVLLTTAVVAAVSAVTLGVITRKAVDVSTGLRDGRLRAPSEFSLGGFLGGGLAVTVVGLLAAAAAADSPLVLLTVVGYPGSVVAAIRIGVWNFFRPQWRPSVGFWVGNATAGLTSLTVLYWLIVDTSVGDSVLAVGSLVSLFVFAVVVGQMIIAMSTSRRRAAPGTRVEPDAVARDPQQASSAGRVLTGTHVFAMTFAVACALAFFVLAPASERTARIRELDCGSNMTAYHISVDDSDAAWGAQFGMVSELPEELNGETSVKGELRDGVFYGPHGLVVGDLTQASLDCVLTRG